MNYRTVLFGFLATLATATAIEERTLSASTVVNKIQILSFDVTLTSTGNSNKKCDANEDFAMKAIIKGALNDLGPNGLGLASDSNAQFSVVDLVLESEIVTDAEEHSSRRRLAGTWVYKAGATCYLCNPDPAARRGLKVEPKVSTGRVIPDSSISAIEDIVTAYFGKNPNHCMASKAFKVKIDFFKA
jgi:hypothetical protein